MRKDVITPFDGGVALPAVCVVGLPCQSRLHADDDRHLTIKTD